MKATKNYLFLFAALIISAMNSAFATNPDGKASRPPVNASIRYQVRVDLPAEQSLCNVYQVEILDGRGFQVAPAKVFVAGVSLYDFYERGPVKGVRIARMVIAPFGKDGDHHFICDREYFTSPVAIQGLFENSQTYKFELFPQVRPIK
jgi:hypothetical protein